MRLHCWLMWAPSLVRLLGPHGSTLRMLGVLHECAACTYPVHRTATLQLAKLLGGCVVARHAVGAQCKL